MMKYYSNKKFSDFYPDANTFIGDYKSSPLYINEITDDSLLKLYYLLYAEYGNSIIANRDENQFKYRLFSLIYEQAPIWQKYISIQTRLRSLTEKQILESSQSIANFAQSPAEYMEHNEDGDILLDYINTQSTSKNYSPLVTSLSNYLSTLSDYTQTFIEMFRSLFIKVVMPEQPNWYEMDAED